MLFLDFSPPSTPSAEQQRDALQKGLGRAVQGAKAGVLDSEWLLDACLHDKRFDKQCEDHRGDWLWWLISITGTASEFREPLLNALVNASDGKNSSQLCDLALYFAQSGDLAFRDQLYAFVKKRQIPDDPSIGESALLNLDGLDAFRFIIRLRGHSLLNRAWAWDDGALVESVIEVHGETSVREILTDSTEPDIRRFATSWLENQEKPGDRDAQREARAAKIQSTTVNDAIAAAETERHSFWLRNWGQQASTSDLELILERVLSEQNPDVIVNLLHVFAIRPFDQFDSRLINLCRHSERKVQRSAFKVLCENSFPEIRDLALSEMQQNSLGLPPVGLLIKNFQPGDEQRILDLVELPEELDDRHWMLIDLKKLLEENSSADVSKLGQIAYFHNPCQMCRCSAAELLFQRNTAPVWLVEECRFDADAETRRLADEG